MSGKPTYEELERKIETLNVKLHKSESNVREIQDLAKIGNWEWDLEQQSLLWSDEIYLILGVEPVSFEPSLEAFEATIHPDDLEDFYKQRDLMLNEKRKVCIDHRIILPNGSIRYVQERIQQIMNRQGEVCRIIGTVQDITDRMQTIEALRASEDKYRSLIYSMDDLVFVLDNNLVFKEYQLPKAPRLYVKPLEFLGKKINEIGFPEQVCSLMKVALDSVFKNRRTTSVEYYLDMPTGRLWFDCKITAFLNNHGEHKEVICVVRDITDRKQAEEALIKVHNELEKRVEERTLELKETHEQLIHSEKLAAIGSLSASIAHEFNNPLFGVLSVFQGVRKRAPLEKEDVELIDIAVVECHRMKDLIKSLQDFNRPLSGQIASLNIHVLIDSLLLLYQKEYTTKDITIETNYSEDMVQIEAVADQIKQVILNILQNAFSACEKGGSVTIDTEVVSEKKIAIKIRDSDKGIKSEYIDKIFDPFFTTKSSIKGTGLGLSVSYGIIKKHGGRIDVESDPGNGAIFIITLPVEGV